MKDFILIVVGLLIFGAVMTDGKLTSDATSRIESAISQPSQPVDIAPPVINVHIQQPEVVSVQDNVQPTPYLAPSLSDMSTQELEQRFLDAGGYCLTVGL